MSIFEIKVENVVAFASLGKDISLKTLIEKLENVEYDPERFPGVVYRIKDPRAATLIFSSGKIVCTGARSVKLAKEAMHKVVDTIRETGVDLPREFEIRIENIVASTQIYAKNKLNLERLAFELENSEYEPESFPGLVYRLRNPKAAFLLFGSGKIICTGARRVEDIHTALEKFKTTLEGLGVDVKPIKNKSSLEDSKDAAK
ncbi:MAG: TATA-box-binding protein [Candidatus Aenigmarchaeota archaeon]|nr:TATA-box-binding protein [Candidatus Aenigmarchaeota archaeon]